MYTEDEMDRFERIVFDLENDYVDMNRKQNLMLITLVPNAIKVD